MSTMTPSFAGEVAFVTGAAGGMGRAIAVAFAAAGASVVLADVADAAGEESARLAHEAGGEAVFVHCDVSDGASGHYGRSGGIEIPEALAHEVLEKGMELSVAIDRFAGAVGIRDAQGAWGVLSNNFITRQEAFRVAVVAAFAPFYNAKMYRAVAVGASTPVR